MGWEFTSLIDRYQKTADKYGVKHLPSLFVLDPEGIIRYSAQGYEEGNNLIGDIKAVLDSMGIQP
jgi:hypothetical protein